MEKKLLLVEDDSNLAKSVTEYLVKRGYKADWASDGIRGISKAESDQYDLIILDIALPGMDGVTLCRRLRQSGNNVPIMFLTSRSGLNDIILGLNMGGDAYITKPFHLTELAARIDAMMRRPPSSSSQILVSGDLIINVAERQVVKNDTIVPLRKKEFAILRLLVEHRTKVFSREELLAKTSDHFEDSTLASTIDVHISHLRKLLGPGIIETVHGLGYRVN